MISYHQTVAIRDNLPSIGSQEQFGPQANLYAKSVGHSSGESLQVIQEWVSNRNYRMAADIGTGTGFTAFAIAPYADNTFAIDITPAMLREARYLADHRGITNLGYILAAAENLPFVDGALDLLTCRLAAHHFVDLAKSLDEWHRVLSPDAVLIIADTASPEDSEISKWMNDVEERRDPSHFHNLSPSQWIGILQNNGFHVGDSTLTSIPIDFDDWVKRSGTPDSIVQSLRRDFINAPSGAVQAFDISHDESGSIHFKWTSVVVSATIH